MGSNEIVAAAIGALGLLQGLLLFIYSRITKRFVTLETMQRALEQTHRDAIRETSQERNTLAEKLHAEVRQGVADMTTALVKQDEEWNRAIERIEAEMARRFESQTESLAECLRSIAVIVNNTTRNSSEVDRLVSTLRGIDTLTQVLKDRIDRMDGKS